LTAPNLQLRGSDNDAWSVQAAQRNVEEAGLGGVIHIDQADATRLPPQPEGTLLLTNPPYGERLGGTGVTELYEQLGRSWRGKNLAGVHVLSGHENFLEHFGWTPLHSQRLANGALEVELLSFAPHR
jgi:putative N6-adenine-specific DNA methylase